MKLSTTSKNEALGNWNFPQIYSLGWFEATSTPTSLNTLSTFMIHEIRRPQKKGMEKQKRIPESMIGGSNKFILVYLILSHNYTHDSSLLHQQLYMSFTPTSDHSTPTLGCYIHKRAGHGKETWQLPWVWIIHWMLMSTLWWTNILPWKITIFHGKIHLISMAIFHCYVGSPEGISSYIPLNPIKSH